MYRSENGGASFSPSEDGLDRRYMAHLVVNRQRPKVVFTAAAAVPPPGWARPQGAQSAVYRSDDQARSWTRLAGGLPEDLRAAPRAVAGDPADPDVVCVGMSDGTVWLTEDSGEAFRAAVRMPVPQDGGRPSGVTSIRVIHE